MCACLSCLWLVILMSSMMCVVVPQLINEHSFSTLSLLLIVCDQV